MGDESNRVGCQAEVRALPCLPAVVSSQSSPSRSMALSSPNQRRMQAMMATLGALPRGNLLGTDSGTSTPVLGCESWKERLRFGVRFTQGLTMT